MALEAKATKKIISVLGSTGDFRMVVPEGTEGAVRREYESSTGEKGVKHELVFKSISGMVTDVNFFDGDYGKNLVITFDFEDGSEPVAVSLGCNTPFGEDVLKKLPNIDFKKPLSMKPYAFVGDNGKPMKGVTIMQGETKVANAFYKPETKESLLDYPKPEGKVSDYDADDWKVYFTQARKHTIKYAADNILPQFGHTMSDDVEVGDDF